MTSKKMIKLDLTKKIAIIDNMTSIDQLIMFISSHQTDLTNWRIIPMNMIETIEVKNDVKEDNPNISDYL